MGWRHQGLLFPMACICALWACNKHAENVVLVSATRGGTDITVHSNETVFGAWQTSAARLSVHAEIFLTSEFLLGHSDHSICMLQCGLLTHGRGAMENIHKDTHTQTMSLTSDFTNTQILAYDYKVSISGHSYLKIQHDGCPDKLSAWVWSVTTISYNPPRHNILKQKLSGRYVEYKGCPKESTILICPPETSLFSKRARKKW